MKIQPLAEHLAVLRAALVDLGNQEAAVDSWAAELAGVFQLGGRLLAAGNGGSAAEAQHLTAELVGRFEGERPPLPAVALHADTSSLTALVNDFGSEEMFARQVEAHGRPGDVLVLLSTSGRSQNLIRAAERGLACGLRVWAMTGPGPNPLSSVAERVISISVRTPIAVQEAHLVAIHALCAAVEHYLTIQPSHRALGPTRAVIGGDAPVSGGPSTLAGLSGSPAWPSSVQATAESSPCESW